MTLPQYYPLPRETVFPSFFPNRLQDFLSGVITNVKLSRKNGTTVQVVPDTELGVAAVNIQGQWRFNEVAIERAHPGGAKGTYVVWAVATKTSINNTPDPYTDHTVYAFDLRITSGANPTGEGVEIFEKIGEIDWSGAAIEAIRQTHGSISGAQIDGEALDGGGDIEWVRQPGGGLQAQLKKDAVGANEIAEGGVGTVEIADASVTSRKIKTTIEELESSSDFTIAASGEYQNVPGLKLEITPLVASKMKIEVALKSQIAHEDSGIAENFFSIKVDEEAERTDTTVHRDGNANGLTVVETIPGLWVVSGLSAAKHTIQVRAKRISGASTNKILQHSKMIATLYAS